MQLLLSSFFVFQAFRSLALTLVFPLNANEGNLGMQITHMVSRLLGALETRGSRMRGITWFKYLDTTGARKRKFPAGEDSPKPPQYLPDPDASLLAWIDADRISAPPGPAQKRGIATRSGLRSLQTPAARSLKKSPVFRTLFAFDQ